MNMAELPGNQEDALIKSKAPHRNQRGPWPGLVLLLLPSRPQKKQNTSRMALNVWKLSYISKTKVRQK